MKRVPTYNQAFKQGFTLVETLLAITILALIIVGSISVAEQSLSEMRGSKERVTAFYLANDAMEYVKNIRTTDLVNEDSITTSGSFFYDLLLSSSGADCAGVGSIGCVIDTTTGTITRCPPSGCPPLLLDTTSKRYQYASGSTSLYTREVTFQTVGSDQVLVTVEVSWDENGRSTSYEVARVFHAF